MPVYNAKKHVVTTLTSIMSQFTNECEIVFCDDGSTDNSIQIIKDLISDKFPQF